AFRARFRAKMRTFAQIRHIQKHGCTFYDHTDIKWSEKSCAQPDRVYVCKSFSPRGEGGRKDG
ncbi:MAG: hypothetical protein O2955_11305, partial [Planctomycetota bacterium]|nr:hypothetical protein [Planctomycetota bacterium]